MFAKEDILFRDYCLKNEVLTQEQWDQFADYASNYGMNEGFSHALVNAKLFDAPALTHHLGKAFTIPVMKLYAETSSAPKEIIPSTTIRERRKLIDLATVALELLRALLRLRFANRIRNQRSPLN